LIAGKFGANGRPAPHGRAGVRPRQRL